MHLLLCALCFQFSGAWCGWISWSGGEWEAGHAMGKPPEALRWLHWKAQGAVFQTSRGPWWAWYGKVNSGSTPDAISPVNCEHGTLGIWSEKPQEVVSGSHGSEGCWKPCGQLLWGDVSCAFVLFVVLLLLGHHLCLLFQVQSYMWVLLVLWLLTVSKFMQMHRVEEIMPPKFSCQAFLWYMQHSESV